MDNHVFYPQVMKHYPTIVKAEGIYLWDSAGKRYTDACCGALVSNIGHGVKEVADAITAQLAKVAFAHRFKFTNEPLQILAERIAAMTPPGIEWVSFVSGGSEATETAVKMAREYHLERGKPSKYKVIARWQSYHGNTLGALSMGGNPGRRRRYAPLLLDFPHAVPAYCYRCPLGRNPDDCGLECAGDVERIILNEGPENVAAVIVEPVGGSSIGAAVPKDGYLQQLRQICSKYDILLIADEVMTGVGRTGANFAVDHWQVVPDMICMAKGVSGGYSPLGAVAVHDSVHAAFRKGSGRFAHGFTFGSNPVSAAAGVAVLNYVRENRLVENSRRQGLYLKQKLLQLADKYPFIGDVRGLGLMMAMEFVQDKATKQPFEPARGLTDAVVNTALDMGLIVYGAPLCIDGAKGDGVMIAPPLTVNEQQLDEIIEALERVLQTVFMEKSR